MQQKKNETLVPPTDTIEIDASVEDFNNKNNYDDANKTKS
jgi:hypothetical protein